MANDVTLSSAALSNLLSLSNTTALIDRTQIRLSTGRAVNSALDDAMAFFKSRDLTSRAQDLTTIKSDIQNGLNVVKTATDSLDQVLSFLTQAKAAANSAAAEKDPAIRATYINQINETLGKLVDLAADANYDGINLVQAIADIDQGSTAGTQAQLQIGAPADPYVPQPPALNNTTRTTMPQTYLDTRLGTSVIASQLDALVASGTPAPALAPAPTAPALPFSITPPPNNSPPDAVPSAPDSPSAIVGNAPATMNAVEAQALGFSTLNPPGFSAAGTVVKSGNSYYIATTAMTATGGTISRIDLPQTATAAQAVYNRYADQQDILAQAAGTAPYTTPNPEAAQRLQARFDRGYQDLVNAEVRNNPSTYQDLEGFTTPETLTVVFSEQDRNRRVDITAQALGDQLTGLVGGNAAILINPADWTATDGKSPNTRAITQFTAMIDDASSRLRAYAAELGNYSNILSVRAEFTDNMVNTLKSGSADLVNADMNAESANMLALQTRQQLGVIALSIAQQSEQAVLKLF